MPFLPARPVRPERCCSVSASRGSSTWTTRTGSADRCRAPRRRSRRSTRARPSRSACSAWLRSLWLCSPDSATALKPRSVRLECSRRTLSRVAQNSSADSRLVEAKQVDHGMLDLGRGDGHRLIGDVAMAALLADRRDAQRVLLVALGQRDDRLAAWSPRRAGCGAQPASRRGSPRDPRGSPCRASRRPRRAPPTRSCGEIERAALEMVAQPARRADDDMGAALQGCGAPSTGPCRRRRSRSARRPCA